MTTCEVKCPGSARPCTAGHWVYLDDSLTECPDCGGPLTRVVNERADEEAESPC